MKKKRIAALKNKTKEKWKGTKVYKATKELEPEELEGKTNKQAVWYLATGIILLVLVGGLIFAAGKIGTMKMGWDLIPTGVTETQKPENRPTSVPYDVTVDSRNITEYMIKKYSLPEGYNFTSIKEERSGENGQEVTYTVISPLSEGEFQIKKDRNGWKEDNFLESESFLVGGDWEKWFKDNYAVEVKADIPITNYWVESGSTGSVTSKLLKNNLEGEGVFNFKLTFNEIPEAVKQGRVTTKGVLKNFLEWVKADNKGFKKEFKIAVETPEGATEYKINIHGEIVN